MHEALRFYRDYAHPQYGVGHMFGRDLGVRLPQAPTAQCLYAVMLYQFITHTGDIEAAREFYPFARSVFEKTLVSVNEHGLGKGIALFPDYPQHCGQDGNDLSSFNNSLLYQAARCMETLGPLYGEPKVGEEAAALARKMEKAFPTLMWDKEKGYIYDSIQSETLEPRKKLRRARAALAKHIRQRPDAGLPRRLRAFPSQEPPGHARLSPLPALGHGLGRRGRQPTQPDLGDGGMRSLPAVLRRPGCRMHSSAGSIIARGFGNSSRSSRATPRPRSTRAARPTRPAARRPSAARASTWRSSAIAPGCRWTSAAITLQEGLARPIKTRQLPFRDAVIELDVAGPGRFLEKLEISGTTVKGSRKIPASLLKGSVKIVARRTEKAPEHPVILSLHGATIHSVEVIGLTLKAEISGWGATWLHLYSPKTPKITLDGKALEAIAGETSGIYRALLPLAADKQASLKVVSTAG